MRFDFHKSRQYLSEFAFGELFREVLGWSNPPNRRVEELEIEGEGFDRQMIAELAGVIVYEIRAQQGQVPNERIRQQIYKEVAKDSLENLLIFVDAERTQSYWYWVKRDGTKFYPRHHTYFKGQSGDLFLGKISGLMVDFAELEDEVSVVQVAQKLQSALDVERVTKKFFEDFKKNLAAFVMLIEGIDNENDRRWYASVILNRLMFVYFLQYKGFVDGNPRYLQDKLAEHGEQNFYRDFLLKLFFDGFAMPEVDRSNPIRELLGRVRYLNGGLFLPHRIEQRYQISISNEAFEMVLELFQSYSWNLDDTPGGQDDEINPAVLGYIFEKYINQKEFGAYYTRPEITEYLCDRTINKLILDKVNATRTDRPFESIEELLFNLDANLCYSLLTEILPGLSLLDPACGSGAFLVAAMKTLINVYSAVIGKVEFLNDRRLSELLKKIRSNHASIQYYIKKRIITDNLYGVDIMEEATEIARLRLFLALVASVQAVEELEPLPNIDFNIMPGNSLIGLIRVDEDGFNGLEGSAVEPTQRNLLEPTVIQGSLLSLMAVNEYRSILAEKNESVRKFKERAFQSATDTSTEAEIRTEMLKSSIEELNDKSQKKLNQLLLNEFSQQLGIKYEEAQLSGKPKKRLLTIADIDALEPFHWGYHFDRILEERGGFDAIIANPPWEVFKPNAKEFFAQHSELVTKKKMDIKAFEKQQKELLKDPDISAAWLQYQSEFPHVSAYYRASEQYKNQISIVNGKKAGTDVNLYKLFLELCFMLLHPYGYCGIIIPTGFYTDLGTKQLREMIFSQTQLDTLLGLSNEKFIFEGVDHRVKFCLLTFEKGSVTDTFEACFRIDPREAIRPQKLGEFLSDRASRVQIPVSLVRQLSPDSVSVMEFRGEKDIAIANKIFQHPKLGEQLTDTWNLKLGAEFHMTGDSHHFKQTKGKNCLPLYEGKMIHQFTHLASEPRYWLNEAEARQSLLGKREDEGQTLNYQFYRLAYRAIARSTDSRTLISTVLPKGVFCGHSLNVSSIIDNRILLFICSVLNSLCFDFALRQQVSANLTMFFIYQTPVPRLQEGDRFFAEIVERAAKLICTTAEFDDLAQSVGIGSHQNGITEERDRAQLRAELDGMIAHLYNLTEAEFAHILSTFPIVPEATKQAALDAYRTFAPPEGDAEIAALIAQGESTTIEFKSTARWNLVENKQDRVMEQVIVKTVAAFLNSQGGTLLIGVDDSGQAIGLSNDYRVWKSGKQNRDGFELWLIGDLLLKELGADLAPAIAISFHILNGQEICKVAVSPAPREVFVTLKDKNGQSKKSFFIRTGNSTRSLDDPIEMLNYIRDRWSK